MRPTLCEMLLNFFLPSSANKDKMKRIIYKTESDGVAVIVPADTIEACMKDIPEGAIYEIVDDVPEDRTFRDAWTWE